MDIIYTYFQYISFFSLAFWKLLFDKFCKCLLQVLEGLRMLCDNFLITASKDTEDAKNVPCRISFVHKKPSGVQTEAVLNQTMEFLAVEGRKFNYTGNQFLRHDRRCHLERSSSICAPLCPKTYWQVLTFCVRTYGYRINKLRIRLGSKGSIA